MIENINELVLIIIAIILQAIGIYFTWKIGKIMGAAKFWILITSALLITLVRRVIALSILFKLMSYTSFIMEFDTLYFPLIFWSLMTLGMFDLYSKVKNKKRR